MLVAFAAGFFFCSSVAFAQASRAPRRYVVLPAVSLIRGDTLDDANNPEGEHANRTTAALYHVKEPSEKVLKPAGEWNHGRIVVLGNHIEHWLNGRRVLSLDTQSGAWRDRIAASKFADATGFGENRSGRLMLQDHEDGVAFKNISIREIKEQPLRRPVGRHGKSVPFVSRTIPLPPTFLQEP